MNRRPSLAAALLGLLLTPLAHGMSVSLVIPEQPLDEVVVEGKRSRLTELRNEMVRLEDQFYTRYNALNDEDDFDVHCARETRAGTRLQSRVCRPVFESDILATEASDYHRDLLLCCQFQSPLWLNPERPPAQLIPSALLIDARVQDFRATILKITRNDPQLLQLLRDRQKVSRRYDATQRRIFGNSGSNQGM